jgi:hypothetical protein
MRRRLKTALKQRSLQQKTRRPRVARTVRRTAAMGSRTESAAQKKQFPREDEGGERMRVE